MASSSYCYRVVEAYSRQIDSYKKAIQKNRNDMDLKNAKIMDDIDDVVNKMISTCDSLKEAINSYYFE